MPASTQIPTTVPADLKPWVRGMVRVGYAAKGIIYLLIGLLAFRLAFGFDGGRLIDASGVLRTLLRQPFGLILLAVIGVGILAYAGWEIFVAIVDARRKGGGVRGWIDRSLAMVKGAVYGMVGVEALRIVLGERGDTSTSAEKSAQNVMRFPLGSWFLVLVGIGIAVYGILQIKMAWQGKFDDDTDRRMVEREVPWMVPLGRAGIGGRAVVLLVMGFALARAGFEERASEAAGYRDSLWSLLSQPYGGWLLGTIALGLMCFGLFQLLHARYARL
ncbi:MAG TPA: DUF1206 domain-containing protein [Vicinamibacterales bacterium]|nr:DUF1206 domain-containing protein [Vicinamibacterales bacterium]